jgi:hypothetical protein
MPAHNVDKEFRSLLGSSGELVERAPSSLKARLYTSLVRRQQESGPLSSLNDSVASGQGICVFEKLVQISPIGEKVKSPFFCHICHARVLAERFDNPPIFWPNCPYVMFKEP